MGLRMLWRLLWAGRVIFAQFFILPFENRMVGFGCRFIRHGLV